MWETINIHKKSDDHFCILVFEGCSTWQHFSLKVPFHWTFALQTLSSHLSPPQNTRKGDGMNFRNFLKLIINMAIYDFIDNLQFKKYTLKNFYEPLCLCVCGENGCCCGCGKGNGCHMGRLEETGLPYLHWNSHPGFVVIFLKTSQ